MALTNRDLTAATMLVVVGWALTGFFLSAFTGGQLGLQRADPGVQVNTFVFTLLVLIFLPLVLTGPRWTTVGTAVIGVLNLALVGIFGLAWAVAQGDMEIAVAAAVNGVLTTVFTLFAVRAYREEAPG